MYTLIDRRRPKLIELPLLQRFFGLAHALKRVVGRPVDLVEKGAIRQPFILASIERSHEVVCAAWSLHHLRDDYSVSASSK